MRVLFPWSGAICPSLFTPVTLKTKYSAVLRMSMTIKGHVVAAQAEMVPSFLPSVYHLQLAQILEVVSDLLPRVVESLVLNQPLKETLTQVS